jgi:hypothetical protein
MGEIVIAPCGYALVIIRAQLYLHRTFRMLFVMLFEHKLDVVVGVFVMERH